jgi:hypothetical protein
MSLALAVAACGSTPTSSTADNNNGSTTTRPTVIATNTLPPSPTNECKPFQPQLSIAAVTQALKAAGVNSGGVYEANFGVNCAIGTANVSFGVEIAFNKFQLPTDLNGVTAPFKEVSPGVLAYSDSTTANLLDASLLYINLPGYGSAVDTIGFPEQLQTSGPEAIAFENFNALVMAWAKAHAQ